MGCKGYQHAKYSNASHDCGLICCFLCLQQEPWAEGTLPTENSKDKKTPCTVHLHVQVLCRLCADDKSFRQYAQA